MDYQILMLSQAIAFMVVIFTTFFIYGYLNFYRKKKQKLKVKYTKSEEKGKKIRDVRLHQRHNT